MSVGPPLITLDSVTIAYRGPALLDQVSCRIGSGERIGLLGRNGAGKTTLLRLLSGAETPDHGRIEIAAGCSIALLPQDVPAELEGTVADVVWGGLPAEWHAPSERWQGEQRLEQIVKTMNLDPVASFRQLSTGWQRRVLLARALVGNPAVLLLDEPTNHLDIDSIVWLESFLLNLSCTLIFVTHDRRFLTRLAQRILEVDRGRLFDWSCDYPTFLTRKEEALAAEEKQNALFDKKLAEEEVWIRQGIKARRTRNEGRVRALEAMRRERQARQAKTGHVKLAIEVGNRSGALVLKTESASFGYGSTPIVHGVTTTVMRGDKIGILGANGAGKTTLLKGLLGQLPPLQGTVRLGTNLEIAYFDQTRGQLNPDLTAADNIGEGKSLLSVNGVSRHVIGYLQDFLFTPEQARSPIRFFSGGQRNRLLLAKLFARPANLLVLDEPTNDLDSETLELLEANLVDYPGTVLVISHDREFLNNVVTSTLVVEQGTAREYVGGYDDWLRQRSVPSSSATDSAARANPAHSRPTAPEPPPKSRKLSYQLQRELAELPARIDQLEKQQAEFHAAMAQEDFYRQGPRELEAAATALKVLDEQIAAAYARWEELESLAQQSV